MEFGHEISENKNSKILNNVECAARLEIKTEPLTGAFDWVD